MKKIVTLLPMIGLIAAIGTAQAYSGQEFRKEAKIGIKEARVIAHNAFPGRIVDEELEKEAGGSGLRYSFDVKKDGVVQEVGVDARTGKILENAPEGPHPD